MPRRPFTRAGSTLTRAMNTWPKSAGRQKGDDPCPVLPERTRSRCFLGFLPRHGPKPCRRGAAITSLDSSAKPELARPSENRRTRCAKRIRYTAVDHGDPGRMGRLVLQGCRLLCEVTHDAISSSCANRRWTISTTAARRFAASTGRRRRDYTSSVHCACSTRPSC